MTWSENAKLISPEDAETCGDRIREDIKSHYHDWADEIITKGGMSRSIDVIIASTLVGVALSLMKRRPEIDREGFLTLCGKWHDKGMQAKGLYYLGADQPDDANDDTVSHEEISH